MLNYLKNNKLARIIAIVNIVFITMVVVITVVIYHPKDMANLTPAQKTLQTKIQNQAGNDLRITKSLASSGSWQLVQVGTTKANNQDNNAMVIMNGDKVVMGPGTYFDINDLIAAKVPDAIIDYLFPDKPQLVNFSSDFATYFPYSQVQVKSVIQSFAVSKNIELKRITITSKISNQVDNPRAADRTETTSFNFTINNDQTVYQFRDFYQADSDKEIYYVLDGQGNVLYSSSVNI